MRLRFAASAGALAFLLAASACGPSLQQIRRYAAASPRRRVAVIPFAPAPGRPNSGVEAAAILSAQLRDMGFSPSQPAEVKAALAAGKLPAGKTPSLLDALSAARRLGASAVLTGTVTAATETKEHRAAIYQDQIKTTTDQHGNTSQATVKVLVSPERNANVRTYSATARLTDVATGDPLWEDSSSDQQEESILLLSQDVLADLARNLGRRYVKKQL